MKKAVKYIGIIMSLIVPISGILLLANIKFNPYNWLWCGFYGCIIVCFLVKSKIYKAVAIVLNLAVALLLGVGSLMGGVYGLMLYLFHIIIPFFSYLFRA